MNSETSVLTDIIEALTASVLFDAFLVTLGFVAVTMTLLRTYSAARKSQLESQKTAIEIDLLRRRIERDVYRANEKLTSDRANYEDTNHLIIDSARLPFGPRQRENRAVPNHAFFSALGLDESRISTVAGTVFVLTPHHPEFTKTYQVIKRATEALGYKVSRGDDVFQKGSILKHIVQSIASAEIVFANIDGRNPNVFYELGIAHAMDKRVMILTSEVDEAPFDVRDQRMVVWSNEDDLELSLTRALAIRENLEGR